MLWVKTFHLVFVVSWFGMLFYLPRLFVNLAQAQTQGAALGSAEVLRLLGMAQRLLRFGTLLAVIALGFGLALWLIYGIGQEQLWLQLKLVVVALLVAYHHACYRLLRQFVAGQNRHSERWYRWFNEVPVLLLVAAIALVLVKPHF